ncbi:pyridoxal-phosphate dependent enzyme [Membranicola marinus]|uniref:Pyridoxal-phosphate dependent enzyme n=1 Tax=Membranihabitans marinus TaxID=1227546 RepID=A0A953L9H2_9BACT|nr:pyridoxal-phosphate dependent enzyme [Membranihabitans marinus]MBY5958845.1 pyridoxal-phosphate dependent enzyme [Membranihabitans marinus]
MNLTEYRHIQNIVRPHISQTPVLSSTILNETYGAKLLFKCENFQKTGSFKFRGALYAAQAKLSKHNVDLLTGHSSGNFAQALAKTAQFLKKQAVLVMPENAPSTKVEAVQRYGGEIIFSGNSPSDRENKMAEYLKINPEAVFIHPSNDLDMIHGNATCAGEFLEMHPEIENLIVPVGGGGLLAGTALARHSLSPETAVYGAEPAGADDAQKSFQSQSIVPSIAPDTIADGLRTQLGDQNFPIILEYVEDILTVTDEEIIEAMKDIYRFLKIVIEPSSAVPLALVRKQPRIFKDKINGIILTGGNIDFRTLAHLITNN